MTGGEKVLIVGAVGLGVVAFLKFRNNGSASGVVTPAGAPPVIDAHFDMSGLGAAGPLAPILAPAQPIVKGAVDKLNSSIGGANPYAGLTRNSDGTYTDGMGCKLTFKPDGTYTRVCPQKSLPAIVATGANKVVGFIKGL